MIHPSLFLRRAIVGDAVITGAMAVLLTAAAGVLGPMLNLPETLLRETGIFLIVYAALVGFLGSRELMPKLAATIPKPASSPRVIASPNAGVGPSQHAKVNAAMSENTKLTPNTFAGCPAPALVSDPVSRFQTLPSSMGEYHSPPTRKLDTAATSTAARLICDICGPPAKTLSGFSPFAILNQPARSRL